MQISKYKIFLFVFGSWLPQSRRASRRPKSNLIFTGTSLHCPTPCLLTLDEEFGRVMCLRNEICCETCVSSRIKFWQWGESEDGGEGVEGGNLNVVSRRRLWDPVFEPNEGYWQVPLRHSADKTGHHLFLQSFLECEWLYFHFYLRSISKKQQKWASFKMQAYSISSTYSFTIFYWAFLTLPNTWHCNMLHYTPICNNSFQGK